MIRTIVVNLARSADRRKVITDRLNALGIKFVLMEATDGQNLSPEQIVQYSSRAAFATIGREMHPNEIGCILSHIRIWQDMIRRDDDRVLVIEDDMLIDSDFPSLIETLDWIPADASVVNLSWDMANPIEAKEITSKRSICRFDKEVMRTGSYIMDSRGAAKLLQNAFPIRMPVDSLMGDERNVGRIYGITPRPVRWDETLPTATWTDATMESFSVSTRNTLKGIVLRLINRIVS
jgi:glycosyl transferase family 25